MPRRKSNSPISYRLHKASGQAFVEIDGRRTYLGTFGAKSSLERYDRIVAEYRAGHSSQPSNAAGRTVNMLLLKFLAHAKRRYVKNGRSTSEVRSYKVAMRPVQRLYGSIDVDAFSPKALETCLQWWVDNGVCRKRANQHLYRVRRIWKWAVKEQMAQVETWQALAAVEGLRRGEGRESRKVLPVAWERVTAAEQHLSAQAWALVLFQWWTGCRPGEACIVRPMDLSIHSDVWEYRPESHKTEHHGLDRVIYLGPQAQAVVTPWLTNRDDTAYLWSPYEAHLAWASARGRRPKSGGPRMPGDCYTTLTYGRAIQRACDSAFPPPLCLNEASRQEWRLANRWSPNQLRHAAATRIRQQFGLELARIILGHQSAVTTEVYAEADRKKAIGVMRSIG